MFYRAELDFLNSVLAKMHIQALCIDTANPPRHPLDLGLRKLLGLGPVYERISRQLDMSLRENTIYKITDEFLCNYILLVLPQRKDFDIFFAGPYLSFEKTREELLEEAERYGVTAARFSQIETCYASIPVIKDPQPLFHMFNVFGEILWGKGNAYEIIDIRQETLGPDEALAAVDASPDPEDVLLHSRVIEQRYAYENELIETVSQGLAARAENMLRGFSMLAFEQRVSDPNRNLKNYCIICNTLLRKAGEKGGVHPIHIDRVSSEFARKVENISSPENGVELMLSMVRTYCNLVRNHSVKNFSPPVQRAITYIDFNLTGDLSLRELARLQNISPNYLSSLFHREYGKTVTEYVNERRMETAAALMRATRLQIQTIAQHCGIFDVNYFSKMFKKYHGITPSQFRQRNHIDILAKRISYDR